MSPWHRPPPDPATAMPNRPAPRLLPKRARDILYLGRGQKPCAPKLPQQNPPPPVLLLPPPPHRHPHLRRDSTCPRYFCLPRRQNRLPYTRSTYWETTRDRGSLHTPCRVFTTLLRCWGGREAPQYRHRPRLRRGIATSTSLETATSAR